MDKVWKPVVGYESFYLISNHGDIRSLDRDGWNGKAFFTIPGKLLHPKTSKFGYRSIGLTDIDGKVKFTMIHRIVAAAFIGPSNLQVNHIDLNKNNNHVSNLEYLSSRENINHYQATAGNSSNLAGVTWRKSNKKWLGQITIGGVKKYLGLFDTAEEAHASYTRVLNEII